MDKNDELRNSLLFFVDEAIGFRKSLHHFHRWLETKEQRELDSLIVEVCREQNYNISPLLTAIRDNNEEQSILELHSIISQGLYATIDSFGGNSLRLPVLQSGIFNVKSLQKLNSALWQLRDWIGTGNTLSGLAIAHQLLLDLDLDLDSYKLTLLDNWIGTDSGSGTGNTLSGLAIAHQLLLDLDLDLDSYKLTLLDNWIGTDSGSGNTLSGLAIAHQLLLDLDLDSYKLTLLDNWITACAEKYKGQPISVLALAHQLLLESPSDDSKLVNMLKLIVGPNTLLSCIIDDDLVLFGNAVSSYYNKHQATHINKLAIAINNSPDLNWKDALSRNQVKSKVWLIEKITRFGLVPKRTRAILSKDTTATIVVGGWVGLIPFLCSIKQVNIGNVINVDVDISINNAATDLNGHTIFENSNSRIQEFEFNKHSATLVIDTIVEHFEHHGAWVATLPKGTNVILQGNDMFDVPDHVNCHNSLEEFLAESGLNTVIWSGELTLHKCTRFMAIGQV